MTTISLIGRPVLNNSSVHRRRSDARWLITFADLAAVMVAFFVLLFSMAEVDSDKWEGATSAFDRQFRISDRRVTPRPVESTNITQRVVEPALDLRYLERVVGDQLKEHEALRDVRMSVDDDRLALDFPGELLFANGRSGVNIAGRETLFVLGGMIANIDNKVAVVGHAAPGQAPGEAPGQVADGAQDIDWELALVRAARVARALRSAGYDRPIELQGRSGSRFGGPAPVASDESSDEPRARPVRRIEIIVQTESGAGE